MITLENIFWISFAICEDKIIPTPSSFKSINLLYIYSLFIKSIAVSGSSSSKNLGLLAINIPSCNNSCVPFDRFFSFSFSCISKKFKKSKAYALSYSLLEFSSIFIILIILIDFGKIILSGINKTSVNLLKSSSLLINILPLFIFSIFAIDLSKVLLPEPFSPIRATILFESISRFTFLKPLFYYKIYIHLLIVFYSSFSFNLFIINSLSILYSFTTFIKLFIS